MEKEDIEKIVIKRLHEKGKKYEIMEIRYETMILVYHCKKEKTKLEINEHTGKIYIVDENVEHCFDIDEMYEDKLENLVKRFLTRQAENDGINYIENS
jgi:hypothetical protein